MQGDTRLSAGAGARLCAGLWLGHLLLKKHFLLPKGVPEPFWLLGGPELGRLTPGSPQAPAPAAGTAPAAAQGGPSDAVLRLRTTPTSRGAKTEPQPQNPAATSPRPLRFRPTPLAGAPPAPLPIGCACLPSQQHRGRGSRRGRCEALRGLRVAFRLSRALGWRRRHPNGCLHSNGCPGSVSLTLSSYALMQDCVGNPSGSRAGWTHRGVRSKGTAKTCGTRAMMALDRQALQTAGCLLMTASQRHLKSAWMCPV